MRNFSSPVDLTVFFFVDRMWSSEISDPVCGQASVLDSVALDSDRRKNWVFALGWEAWM